MMNNKRQSHTKMPSPEQFRESVLWLCDCDAERKYLLQINLPIKGITREQVGTITIKDWARILKHIKVMVSHNEKIADIMANRMNKTPIPSV